MSLCLTLAAGPALRISAYIPVDASVCAYRSGAIGLNGCVLHFNAVKNFQSEQIYSCRSAAKKTALVAVAVDGAISPAMMAVATECGWHAL